MDARESQQIDVVSENPVQVEILCSMLCGRKNYWIGCGLQSIQTELGTLAHSGLVRVFVGYHDEIARMEHGSAQQKEQYADKLRIPLTIQKKEDKSIYVRQYDLFIDTDTM